MILVPQVLRLAALFVMIFVPFSDFSCLLGGILDHTILLLGLKKPETHLIAVKIYVIRNGQRPPYANIVFQGDYHAFNFLIRFGKLLKNASHGFHH